MEAWTTSIERAPEARRGSTPPEVTVLLHGRTPLRARVSEVLGSELAVEVPKTVTLALGATVLIGLSPSGVSVTLKAEVRSRSEGLAGRVYGVRFASAELALLPQGLHALFNRRRAERYNLRRPLPVTLSPLASALNDAPPSGLVLAALEGASRTGCSLLLSHASDARLTANERLLIRLDIPQASPGGDALRGDDAPDTWRTLSVGVTVLHRSLTTDGNVRYGCELDQVDRGSEALVRFVSGAREREQTAS